MREQISANRRLQHALSARVEHLNHAWSSSPSDEEAQHIDQRQQSVQDNSSASITYKHPRELLQDTLWPLTHAAQPRNDDLNPHAAPKARELYDRLLRGLPKPPWYMINPDGTARSSWDFLLAVFTMALFIYVPVLIAFYSNALECTFVAGHTPISADELDAPAQPNSGVQFMTLTNIAFLVDIILNFLTGVRQYNHETNMVEYCYNVKTVAVQYTKSWLLLDVVSCLPVECMIRAAGIAHSYNLGHVNRLLKVFGLRRRAHGDPFRLINHIPFIRRNFNYSLRLVVVSASALLLGLHYFACGLWLVLRVQGFPDGTWPVQLHLLEDINVYKCWTWCVFAVTSAMIGLGYGSYPPLTFPEAVLWIVEMMLMAGGFAVVNGFILSAILEFLASKGRYKAKLLQVQREVERRRLPAEMQQKVLEYFELKHSDQNVQDGPAIMTELAPGLRLEVALATVGQLLAELPVLQSHPQLLQRVALLVERQVAPEGQLIAIPGTPHEQLLFITRGYADLYMVTDVGEVLIDTLVAGDSFGEASLLPVPPPDLMPSRLHSLWSSSGFSGQYWPVLFSLRALSNCSLAVLNAEAFSKLVQEYDETQEQLQRWSEHHAAVLNALPQLEQLWSAAAVFNPMRDRPRSFAHPGAAANSIHNDTAAATAATGGDSGARGGVWKRDVLSLLKLSKQREKGDRLNELGRKARLPTSLR